LVQRSELGGIAPLATCLFLRQGSNYRSTWHEAARIKRWVYQSVGNDLVA